MTDHFREKFIPNIGHDPIAYPLHENGVAVTANAAGPHDEWNKQTSQEHALDPRAFFQDGVVGDELLRGGRATLEDSARDLADHQGHETVADDAEAEAEGE